MCLFPKRPYLLNKHTKEIHHIEKSKSNCRINLMATKNKQRITYNKAIDLIRTGKADGCRWCMNHLNFD
jgi:hypothetical protein